MDGITVTKFRDRKNAMIQRLRFRKVESKGTVNLWADVKLDRQWQVSYRLVVQGGVPVIGEVRVLPRHGSKSETWTDAEEKFGLLAAAPAGGVRSTLLRRVGVPAVGRAARQFATILKDAVRASEEQHGARDGETIIVSPTPVPSQPEGQQRSGSRRGRKGKGEAFYARIAETYIAEVEKNKHRGLAEVVQKQHGLSTVEHARVAIFRAREKGFIGGTRVTGKAQGFLTDKAKAVLRRSGTPKKATTRKRAAKKKGRAKPRRGR